MGGHHFAGRHGLVEDRADHAVAAGVLHAFPGGDRLRHLETLGLGVADAIKMEERFYVHWDR